MQSREPASESKGMYARLGGSLLASLVAMYALAFSQIDTPDHFHPSLSVFWISLSMVSAMGLIMLTAMKPMMPRSSLNRALVVGFAVLLVAAFAAGRTEALVGDDAFLRSMIPHHSRAIHMCEEAALADPDVQALCRKIVESQTAEIRQMEAILTRRA